MEFIFIRLGLKVAKESSEDSTAFMEGDSYFLLELLSFISSFILHWFPAYYNNDWWANIFIFNKV